MSIESNLLYAALMPNRWAADEVPLATLVIFWALSARPP